MAQRPLGPLPQLPLPTIPFSNSHSSYTNLPQSSHQNNTNNNIMGDTAVGSGAFIGPSAGLFTGVPNQHSMLPVNVGRGRGRGRTLPAWMTQNQHVSGSDGRMIGGNRGETTATTTATPTTQQKTSSSSTQFHSPAKNQQTLQTTAISSSSISSSVYPKAPWNKTMTLKGHTNAVLCVCLNESGSHCLTGGQDRTIRLWNPRNNDPNKNLVATFNDGRITHSIADMTILPGSKKFITCGGTTRALLWDLKTKQLSRYVFWWL
jgi:WD40 repeat protein